MHDSFEGQNLASLNILVQSSGGTPSTANDCKKWRAQYGHEDVVTLYDSTGQAQVLWHNNYTALSVFVDGDFIIEHKFNTDVQSQVTAEIQKLLAD